jgi:hypothetical protein
MINIFIRCSSPGLFAGGVKKIRRVYCTGSAVVLLNIFSDYFYSMEIVKKTVRDWSGNPSQKIVAESQTRQGNGIFHVLINFAFFSLNEIIWIHIIIS